MDATGKTYEIHGLDALEKQFEALAVWAYGDVVKEGLKAGAEIVAAEARRLVPVKTGRLKRAIKVRPGRKGKGSFSMLVSAGEKNFQGEEFYGAFQEFGWKSGKRPKGAAKSKADNRKQNPGEHYMEYAADSKAEEAGEAVLKQLGVSLDRELSK